MEEKDKTSFCRALATLRAMYPNEYNMSELVPVAYWVACRDTSLAAVKEAILRLIRSTEWLRQMPPAPVLAEQARLIERQRARNKLPCVAPAPTERKQTAQSIAWAKAAHALSERYVRDGLERGPATLRAVRSMLEPASCKNARDRKCRHVE